MRERRVPTGVVLLVVLLAGVIAPIRSGSAATVWVPVADMLAVRDGHVAVRLIDGRVLVAGGNVGDSPTAEVFDPVSRQWSMTHGLTVASTWPTLTMLHDGTVLLVSGRMSNGEYTDRCFLFEPETNNWTEVAPLGTERSSHRAVLLPNGQVLVSGGSNVSDSSLATAEIYDPIDDSWSFADDMEYPRASHTLTMLDDGTVLAVGGFDGLDAQDTAERYDFSTNVWTPTGSLTIGGRIEHGAVLLDDGRVLVAAGMNLSEGSLPSSELYDPLAEQWVSAGELFESVGLSLTLLHDGNVLAAGGKAGVPISTAMIFNPRTGHWFSTDQMRLARAFPAAILLQDGSVLVAGGNAGVDGTATAEIYPANQSPVAYAPVQSLRVSTIDQTAVPVTIGWRVAGDSDPIDAYQLQQRTNGGTFVTVPLDSATSTSRMRKLNPGSSHRFRVRATDARGATSSFSLGPPKTLVAVQDGETIEIAYEGAWTTSTIPNFFGNTARVSTTAGSTATLKFTGTNVGWVTRRSPTSGKAEVYLDGVRVATIDLYSPTPRFRQMVFVRNGLASATHTLEIRVLGTKSAASGGTRIDIDAYVVLQ